MEVMEKFKGNETPATVNTIQDDDEEDEVEVTFCIFFVFYSNFALQDVFRSCPEEVVCAVRKQLCPALRDMLQHGLLDPVKMMFGRIGQSHKLLF